MKVIKIKHVNYNGSFNQGYYYFKSDEDIKINDYVECDTRYGCMIGIVCEVSSAIEDLITNKVQVDFACLKDCRRYKGNYYQYEKE